MEWSFSKSETRRLVHILEAPYEEDVRSFLHGILLECVLRRSAGHLSRAFRICVHSFPFIQNLIRHHGIVFIRYTALACSTTHCDEDSNDQGEYGGTTEETDEDKF